MAQIVASFKTRKKIKEKKILKRQIFSQNISTDVKREIFENVLKSHQNAPHLNFHAKTAQSILDKIRKKHGKMRKSVKNFECFLKSHPRMFQFEFSRQN